jgi:hypothetical protein
VGQYSSSCLAPFFLLTPFFLSPFFLLYRLSAFVPERIFTDRRGISYFFRVSVHCITRRPKADLLLMANKTAGWASFGERAHELSNVPECRCR